jgi:hypothetical protein
MLLAGTHENFQMGIRVIFSQEKEKKNKGRQIKQKRKAEKL